MRSGGAPVRCEHDGLPVLVWRLPEAPLVISSAFVGGGTGRRGWIVNAQVPSGYARTDVAAHVDEIARAAGLADGAGVGMLTAADVDRVTHGRDGAVAAWATVGLHWLTRAADVDGAKQHWSPGTINVVVRLPARLSDAALVNAVVTATEAKVQALADCSVPGTGTASDAICIVCPATGDADPFGGPRSALGAPLARAVHVAVRAGLGEARP